MIDIQVPLESQKKILISNERLSGCPYRPTNPTQGYFEQFQSTIDSIACLYDYPRIVCCFREPSSLIQSMYKQYLHEGGTCRFEEFFALRGGGITKPHDFYLSRFIEYLIFRFRREDLFLYNFSDFQERRDLILSHLIEFIGSDLKWSGNPKQQKQKGNPSVPLHLEKCLMQFNKLNHSFRASTGMNLQLKLFGKTLNGRVLAQYILPRIYKRNDLRDLGEFKDFYSADWKRTRELLALCTPIDSK